MDFPMGNNKSCKLYIARSVTYDLTKFMEKQNFNWDLNMLSNEKDIMKYSRTQVGKSWLLGKYNPRPVCVNKILVEHGHIHSLTCI